MSEEKRQDQASENPPHKSRTQDNPANENKPIKLKTNNKAENGKKKKLSCHILRDTLGGVPKKALELSRKHAKLKKEVKKALQEGPKTVPQIAKVTHLSSEEVLWHLMSLRKYGEVIDGEEEDSYLVYKLKPKEEKQS